MRINVYGMTDIDMKNAYTNSNKLCFALFGLCDLWYYYEGPLEIIFRLIHFIRKIVVFLHTLSFDVSERAY